MMEKLSCKKISFAVLGILICCMYCSTEGVNETALQRLANANNEFSMKLHRRLALNSGSNIFFSPMSLFLALGMLCKGARGHTEMELRKFLGLNQAGLSDDEINNSLKYLLTEIFNSSRNYTLKTANAILVDEGLNLVPEYKYAMKNIFDANVLDVNFRRETKAIVQRINDWIKHQTNGKIQEFLDELSPSTIMTVLNAIYFKGLWSVSFKKQDTQRMQFHNYGGTMKWNRWIPMMYKSHKMLYASSPDWQMVEMPYLGDKISMVIVLPEKLDGLAAVENSLTPEQIRLFRNKMRMLTVNLWLPTFKINSNIDMSEHLKSMGLGNMFGNGANFSGMVEGAGVRVSQVMHKALVEVNEEGTEAAAASGVHIVPLTLSVPRDFKADHPFFFAIIEKSTNLIIFSGRVIML